MRRILLFVILCLALAPASAAAQVARGGFVMVGEGGGGTPLMTPRLSLGAGYTVEVANRTGAYVGGRYVFGIHWLRADEDGFRERFGDGASTVEGGSGTLYDTGADIEVGFSVKVLRVYGFTGIHYYQQYQDPASVRSGPAEVEVVTRRRESLSNARGVGVHLRLTDEGAVVGEWFRGGGDDGVMRLSGTRFGLRWAW